MNGFWKRPLESGGRIQTVTVQRKRVNHQEPESVIDGVGAEAACVPSLGDAGNGLASPP